MSRAGGSRPGPAPQILDKIRAPYNFVPLSPKVVTVPWAEQIQHDCPFKGGISGRLELRMQALGPLFVRGADGGFFQTPDGAPAIPGSSIRGMLRAVVEIASFSRMDRVNDHTYGVRDLHNRNLYGRHMAEIVQASDGRKQPMPLVSAGWLRRNNQPDDNGIVAHITPCSFAKVHYNFIKNLAEQRGLPRYEPGRAEARSPEKYGAWGSASLKAQVTVLSLLNSNPFPSAPRIGSFGKVTSLDGPTKGTLVFTGQPNQWPARNKRARGGNPKQHDFFFHTSIPGQRLGVKREVFQAFEFVHSKAAGQQHRVSVEPNDEWKYWKKRAFDKDEDVPVFFLLDQRGNLRAFGLAMMFRLAYDHSTLDVVRNVQGLTPPGELDMARAIFGHVPMDGSRGDGEHGGLKGRVSFGLGRLEGGVARTLRPVTAVLGAPKASYYPSYLEQGDKPGAVPPRDRNDRPRYRTYMDSDARPRGWKRYVQRDGTSKPELPTRADGSALNNDDVTTSFKPIELPERGYFRIPVRVHNLRCEELGALLWALDFGGHERARHGLGMAKSLGYGSITLTVDAGSLNELFVLDDTGTPNNLSEADLAEARSAYASFMEQQLVEQPGGWAGSRQLHELLTLARPIDEPADMRHMRIGKPNEFVQAKKDGLSLRALGTDTWRGAQVRQKVQQRAPKVAVPAGWVRATVRYSPNNGELSTSIDGVIATANRGECQALLGSLSPDEAKRLKKKKTASYEIRLDTVGNRRRIAGMRKLP